MTRPGARLTRGSANRAHAGDAWSLTVPFIGLLITCALSALLPALRATQVDPLTALRSE